MFVSDYNRIIIVLAMEVSVFSYHQEVMVKPHHREALLQKISFSALKISLSLSTNRLFPYYDNLQIHASPINVPRNSSFPGEKSFSAEYSAQSWLLYHGSYLANSYRVENAKTPESKQFSLQKLRNVT